MIVHMVQFLGSKSISIPQLLLLEARDYTGKGMPNSKASVLHPLR